MAENNKRSFGTWFREMKSELKKVVWPTPKQVYKNTCVVLAVCAVVAVIIGIMDWVLTSGVALLLKL